MARLGGAWSFQQRKIRELKKRPFARLAALPGSKKLEGPKRLRGLNILVCRAAAPAGAVAITVHVELGGMASTQGFEMTPRGRIA